MGGHVPRVPHQIAPMQPIMTLVQITNYSSPNCTDRPKWMYTVLNIFSPFTSFKQLALALEKQSCPENFHCIGSEKMGFLSNKKWVLFTLRIFNNLCLPWKQSFPWNFTLYFIYNFYHSGFLSNFVLFLKNRGCPEFTVLIIYFLSFRIFEQLALALKNRVALIFSLH